MFVLTLFAVQFMTIKSQDNSHICLSGYVAPFGYWNDWLNGVWEKQGTYNSQPYYKRLHVSNNAYLYLYTQFFLGSDDRGWLITEGLGMELSTIIYGRCQRNAPSNTDPTTFCDGYWIIPWFADYDGYPYDDNKFRYCTPDPTNAPTTSQPTSAPSIPTKPPSMEPTLEPTFDPTMQPTMYPTRQPTDETQMPSNDPTIDPTFDPIFDPTVDPSIGPTLDPTTVPTTDPTRDPTDDITNDPSVDPTIQPTSMPSSDPTTEPTGVGDATDGSCLLIKWETNVVLFVIISFLVICKI